MDFVAVRLINVGIVAGGLDEWFILGDIGRPRVQCRLQAPAGGSGHEDHCGDRCAERDPPHQQPARTAGRRRRFRRRSVGRFGRHASMATNQRPVWRAARSAQPENSA
jgi:hypothetical protein